MSDELLIAGIKFNSRLFLGTGKFGSSDLMAQAIKSSGTELVTVALRRIDPGAPKQNILSHIPENIVIMTNTSGARNASEAVRIAKFAKEAGCGNWIKIEVIPDCKYLMPDNDETVKATEILVAEGFIVMPYFNPDLVVARRLRNAGAASVMPLGSPIGSGKGIQTREMIKILIGEMDLPVIVDAGIGLPSHAADAMELGAAAVLVNTAVAVSDDPPMMAEAFSSAVKAGRLAFLAGGRHSLCATASASSPETGFIR